MTQQTISINLSRLTERHFLYPKEEEMITAERVKRPDGMPSVRTLYKLSEPTTVQRAYEVPAFEYVVLSIGRSGDTCVFPSDDQGKIIDLVGFGYSLGPSRWLVEAEFDGYVEASIKQHVADVGSGFTPCFEWPEQVAA